MVLTTGIGGSLGAESFVLQVVIWLESICALLALKLSS